MAKDYLSNVGKLDAHSKHEAKESKKYESKEHKGKGFIDEYSKLNKK